MALELNSSLELVESKITVKGKELNVDEIQDLEIYWIWIISTLMGL